MLVEFGLATELSHSLGRGLDVLDGEEQIRTRALVAAVQAPADVLGLDLEAECSPDGPGFIFHPNSSP